MPAEKWNDWKWQLKNRVSSLAKLEQLIAVTPTERAGALLAGSKLSLAVTPHFFNLIEPDNADCPIRRQVIPRMEEGYTAPWEMADPCGEDSHMPVPGLVHRYPDQGPVPGNRPMRFVLSLLHSQSRGERRRRTGVAHGF